MINLRDQTALVHRDPNLETAEYTAVSTLSDQEDLHLDLPDGQAYVVALETLLP